MSDSDKSRVRRHAGWGLRGHGYQTRGDFQSWRDMRTRQGRRRAKAALRQEQDPEPYRPRHSALWDWNV